MSSAVLLGFVPAATTLIVASQIPAALGAPGDDELLAGALSALAHPGVELGALALSAATTPPCCWARRVGPLFPGVLLAVGLGILATELLGYRGPTVGEVPSGLPPVSLDLPWGDAARCCSRERSSP